MSSSPNDNMVSAALLTIKSFLFPDASCANIDPTNPKLIFCADIVPLALISPEAVKSPVKLRSSVNETPFTSPPADWNLFANIVPLALIFPEAVIFVAVTSPLIWSFEVGVAVPIPILSVEASM